MEENKKPPLGLIPYKFWVLIRVGEIEDAIKRYEDVGKEVPIEWIEEYNNHVKKLNEESVKCFG